MRSFSVIIPTLNEEKYIGLLLQDIQEQSVPPQEVIVVDGYSTDNTATLAQSFPLTTVYLCEKSVSRQRNKGAEYAIGDVLFFLDADTRIDAHFFEQMLSRFESKKLELACPLYSPGNSHFVIWFVYWYVNLLFVLLAPILPSGAGPCMVVSRDVFLKHEGFRDGQNFEDMEWIRRLGRKHRYGIIFKTITASDRRFRTYGMFRMIVIYALMSLLFTLGLFKLANKIKYSFEGDLHR